MIVFSTDDQPLIKRKKVQKNGSDNRVSKTARRLSSEDARPRPGGIDISDVKMLPEYSKIMSKKLVVSVHKLSEAEIDCLSRGSGPVVGPITSEMLQLALHQLKKQNDEILTTVASLKPNLSRPTTSGTQVSEVVVPMASSVNLTGRHRELPGPSSSNAIHNSDVQGTSRPRQSFANFTYEPAYPEITIDWLQERENLSSREFVRELMQVIFEVEDLLNRNATGKRAPVNRRHRNQDGTVVKGSVDPVRFDFICRK